MVVIPAFESETSGVLKKLAPLIVTATEALFSFVAGVIDDTTGADMTVKKLSPVATFVSVFLTNTLHAPVVAPVRLNVPVKDVCPVLELMLSAVIGFCPGFLSSTNAPLKRFVPKREVIVTVLFVAPLVGVIDVSVGASEVTVKYGSEVTCANMLVTTASHVPIVAFVKGRLDVNKVYPELVVTDVAFIVEYPVLLNVTVLPG